MTKLVSSSASLVRWARARTCNDDPSFEAWPSSKCSIPRWIQHQPGKLLPQGTHHRSRWRFRSLLGSCAARENEEASRYECSRVISSRAPYESRWILLRVFPSRDSCWPEEQLPPVSTSPQLPGPCVCGVVWGLTLSLGGQDSVLSPGSAVWTGVVLRPRNRTNASVADGDDSDAVRRRDRAEALSHCRWIPYQNPARRCAGAKKAPVLGRWSKVTPPRGGTSPSPKGSPGGSSALWGG